MTDQSTHSRYLRTPEAAAYCAVSESLLEKRRLTGEKPRFIKLSGRLVIYDRDDLDSWLNEGRRSSTSAEAAS